jgi:hypothetical protein
VFKPIYDIAEIGEIELVGDQASITTSLLVCHETSRMLQLVCRLDLSFSSSMDVGYFHEFSFELAMLSLDGSSEDFTTQDRDIVRKYLPQECVKDVLPLVERNCRALIERFAPNTIYIVTKDRNPPEKAMEKHLLITKAIENAGYYVLDAGTDPFGRCFWLLRHKAFEES